MIEYPYVSFEVEVTPNSKRLKTVWRPVVEIIIFRGGNYAAYPVLIDSGADYNIFHGGILQALGGRLSTGKKRRIVGLGNQQLKGYEHKIDIKLVGGQKFGTNAIFSNQIPDHALGVLGQQGFFEKYNIEFKYKTKKIIIN